MISLFHYFLIPFQTPTRRCPCQSRGSFQTPTRRGRKCGTGVQRMGEWRGPIWDETGKGEKSQRRMQVKLNLFFFNSQAVIKYYLGTVHSGDWSLSLMLYLFIETMGLSLTEQRQRQEDRHQKLTARDKPHHDFLDFGFSSEFDRIELFRRTSLTLSGCPREQEFLYLKRK